MKRPRQHEIDELARRQFESSLPSSWVCRPMPDDYGVDYEVEVFDNGVSTGRAFKVQLKGKEAADVSADGQWVPIAMEAANLRYLCAELEVPAIVVVADVTARVTYWGAPMLDRDLMGRLDDAGHTGQNQFTVRLPTSHRLPESLALLLNAVADIELVLGTRAVSTASLLDFTRIAQQQFDAHKLIRSFQEKTDSLRIVQIRRSVTAMEPCLPTAPRRCFTFQSLSSCANSSPTKTPSWSLTRCLGGPWRRKACSKASITQPALGPSSGTTAITAREK